MTARRRTGLRANNGRAGRRPEIWLVHLPARFDHRRYRCADVLLYVFPELLLLSLEAITPRATFEGTAVVARQKMPIATLANVTTNTRPIQGHDVARDKSFCGCQYVNVLVSSVR
eukprot:TRINITY_DN1895_c0_g1_i2.p1 TRINITY_DN1895_c0_g1~~TRINITY_DN1895_c0_g1_i2.p1  ORF type:complete len:115 (-),score=4.19 TRINITY_DN1895_c0_g1_i2:130-474(-)